jgi:hypothetical protein
MRQYATAQLILNLGTKWMCGHLQAFKTQPLVHTEQDVGQAMELAWTLW